MTAAWVEVLIRLVQFACALVLFGVPAFTAYRHRAWNEAGPTGTAFQKSLIASAIGLFLAASAAILALTVRLYGTLADALDIDAIWSVLTGLQVGVALGVRLLLTTAFLLVVLVMPDRTAKRFALLVIGGMIVAGFAWSGHGAATEGPWALVHLISDILHLLAAAIWIGALVLLTRVLLRSSGAQEAALVRQDLTAFSTIGTLAVLVIVVTGLVNSTVLIGVDRIGQMTAHPYGQILLAKVALFSAMIGLAAANRYIFVPRLELQDPVPTAALSSLKSSVGVETLLGLLVLLAVAVMGRIAPMSGG